MEEIKTEKLSFVNSAEFVSQEDLMQLRLLQLSLENFSLKMQITYNLKAKDQMDPVSGKITRFVEPTEKLSLVNSAEIKE